MYYLQWKSDFNGWIFEKQEGSDSLLEFQTLIEALKAMETHQKKYRTINVRVLQVTDVARVVSVD